MPINFYRSRLRQWLSPSRLFPLLTIIGAGLANVLSLLGILSLSIPEAIIIALLALLAIDALVERISVLERIETRLSNLTAAQSLQSRANILQPTDHAKDATEICILGLHLISALTPYLSFYEQKLRNGCKIRIVLMDPECAAIDALNRFKNNQSTQSHIEVTLEAIKALNKKVGSKNKCEVHLSPIFLPYSLFAIDISKDSGSMIVEYLSYDVSIGDRPHVHLTVTDSRYWFAHYQQQFEKVWSESRKWSG